MGLYNFLEYSLMTFVSVKENASKHVDNTIFIWLIMGYIIPK